MRKGQILISPVFNEPMQVETVRPIGSEAWVAGLVGQQSERFRRVTLTAEDISTLTVYDSTLSYGGDGGLLRVALQAYSLGIAYDEFEPYFGFSISRVDPLPHQLEAVYEHLLKLPSVRFLLADDAGSGKTVMAGLLVRELKLRGLIERVLVVCPANWTLQWQRELRENFDEKFTIFKGNAIRDQFGVNQWLEQNQIVTSLDLAKRTEILPRLQQMHWNLVIVDEAHRMSARDQNYKSQRYRLGELLRDATSNMLLLTATPHKGNPTNFTLFLQLLDQTTAETKNLELVTSGHLLFEALRRRSLELGRDAFVRGAGFHIHGAQGAAAFRLISGAIGGCFQKCHPRAAGHGGSDRYRRSLRSRAGCPGEPEPRNPFRKSTARRDPPRRKIFLQRLQRGYLWSHNRVRNLMQYLYPKHAAALLRIWKPKTIAVELALFHSVVNSRFPYLPKCARAQLPLAILS